MSAERRENRIFLVIGEKLSVSQAPDKAMSARVMGSLFQCSLK